MRSCCASSSQCAITNRHCSWDKRLKVDERTHSTHAYIDMHTHTHAAQSHAPTPYPPTHPTTLAHTPVACNQLLCASLSISSNMRVSKHLCVQEKGLKSVE